jgi:hypothetical protein
MFTTITQATTHVGQCRQEEVGRPRTIDKDVPMDKPMDIDESTNYEAGEGELMELNNNTNEGKPMDID